MRTSLPLASFCFTTYKRQDYLRSTLESVRRQTFKDFEVVVCDNDPEASAKIVMEEFNDARFKYYANDQNLGMKKSYNKSLQHSCGEYIVMIADDDPVYPDMLETLVTLKNKYPNYGMYLGGCDWFCMHHEVAKLYGLKVGTNTCLSNNHDLNHIKAFEPGEFVMNLFTFKLFPHYLWSTAMVKREVLIERGGVPDYGTPFLGDYAYMSIMGSHSGCVIINKALGCQTLHNENFGRNQNEQLITAAKNFPEYVASKMSYLKEWPVIKEQVQNFVGLWVISHLSFLHKYGEDREGSLAEAERNIFAIDFMQKFKLKYFIKRKFPFLHDQLVTIKRKLKK